jgi:murein L,D-transpeptidase YafK
VRFVRAWLLILLALLGAASCKSSKSPPLTRQADLIVIVKSAHTMTLISGSEILKTYKVALGRGHGGPKEHAGGHKTPERSYVIDSKNAHSRFYLALHISYPDATDLKRARNLNLDPGGAIEIHGLPPLFAWLGRAHLSLDWTDGCIAVTNSEIEEIWPVVQVGTRVEIRP